MRITPGKLVSFSTLLVPANFSMKRSGIKPQGQGIFWLKSLKGKISSGSKASKTRSEMFQTNLKCSEKSKMFSKFEIFWNLLMCSEMVWDVLKCSEMFWNVLKCFEMCLIVLKCSKCSEMKKHLPLYSHCTHKTRATMVASDDFWQKSLKIKMHFTNTTKNSLQKYH